MVFMMVVYDQRYKCLNCNRCFIKQEELKVRKRKGLTEYEKHIIDRLVDENISYRTIVDSMGVKTCIKHHSKICVLRILKKKLNEVLEKFEMKFMELNKV